MANFPESKIIKYIAGFKFININITNYQDWDNFKKIIIF